jgi:hypothetical protein
VGWVANPPYRDRLTLESSYAIIVSQAIGLILYCLLIFAISILPELTEKR